MKCARCECDTDDQPGGGIYESSIQELQTSNAGDMMIEFRDQLRVMLEQVELLCLR